MGAKLPACRWVLLSDGAEPTEDIYFMRSAAPWLVKQGIPVRRLNVRSRFCLPQLALRHLAGANVLVCRSLPATWLTLLEANRGLLARVFYLVDDDLQAAANDVTLPHAYRQRMAGVAHSQQPRILTLADEVVTCSKALAERFDGLHSRVCVLTPPLITRLPGMAHFSDTAWRIGYHGTRAHRQDLANIVPALVQFHAQMTAGNPRAEMEIMFGKFTPDALRALPGVRHPHPLPWRKFLRYRQQHRVHIGLAPLWDSPLNRGKSFIKFLDITAMGGVGIYSRRSPYAEVVDDGVDGLLATDDAADWLRCLQRLMDDPQHTAMMAVKAAEKARRMGDVDRVRQFWLGRSTESTRDGG